MVKMATEKEDIRWQQTVRREKCFEDYEECLEGGVLCWQGRL